MPDPMKVTDSALTEFENAVSIACARQRAVPFQAELDQSAKDALMRSPAYFQDRTGALVISFDASLHPFLCDTRGYNQTEERWYLPEGVTLLNKIADAIRDSRLLASPEPSGGRVFCYSDGAVRRSRAGSPTLLVSWLLPRYSQLLAAKWRLTDEDLLAELA